MTENAPEVETPEAAPVAPASPPSEESPDPQTPEEEAQAAEGAEVVESPANVVGLAEARAAEITDVAAEDADPPADEPTAPAVAQVGDDEGSDD